MKRFVILASALVALFVTAADSAELKVLSAGAVEPGLHRVIEQFKRTSGHNVTIQFNTAPQIGQRLQDGYVADVVIAPPAVLKTHTDAGRFAGDRQVVVGKVGIGIVVRNDAPAPKIASSDDIKAEVLAADSVVYNVASTGLYLERLFERLGVTQGIKDKSTRPQTGEAVMQTIMGGKGRQIGFGAITEIKLFEAKGQLKYVGPLPADAQNYTTYAAALMTNAPESEAAKALIAYLQTAEAKQSFSAAGID
jgi:molybdate transport system substrate-binding protein